MSAQILDGNALAFELKNQLAEHIKALKDQYHENPRIVSIVIGDDPAALSYALSQQRTAESLGIHYELQRQLANISEAALIRFIEDLNNYSEVHAIILNKPLPAHLKLGQIIEHNACVSGAEGGCQAECGSAAAMAAAAVVEMAGGTPQEAIEAATLAIKNLLGLACDPVAGLVEVPCVKRNGILAGFQSASGRRSEGQ